jgi:hypothetical protein
MATPIQLVFDTHDPDAEARFWAEALHYQLQPPPGDFATWEDFARANDIPESEWNDSSAIVDPDGNGPRIYFQKVPEGKTAKNRMHMDLNVSGGRGIELDERKRRVDAEVERLKALGASDHRGSGEEPGGYWVRMNDPEGNEFCVQ